MQSSKRKDCTQRSRSGVWCPEIPVVSHRSISICWIYPRRDRRGRPDYRGWSSLESRGGHTWRPQLRAWVSLMGRQMRIIVRSSRIFINIRSIHTYINALSTPFPGTEALARFLLVLFTEILLQIGLPLDWPAAFDRFVRSCKQPGPQFRPMQRLGAGPTLDSTQFRAFFFRFVLCKECRGYRSVWFPRQY